MAVGVDATLSPCWIQLRVRLPEALCSIYPMLRLFTPSLGADVHDRYFFPSIVQTLGYGDTETLLLTAPPYFFAFFVAIGIAIHSGRKNERCFHIVVPMCVSAIGQIIYISKTRTGPRYFAMFLMTSGVYAAFNLVMAWISSAIPRPRTKRAVAMALCTGLANASRKIPPLWIYET